MPTMTRFCLIAFAAAAHAAPAPKGKPADVTYLATQEGAIYVYAHRTGETGEVVFTDNVTKVERKPGAVHVTITREYPGSNPWVRTIAVTSEGQFWVSNNGTPLADRIQVLKRPARVGTKWKVPGGARYEVTMEEEVEVPAGRFRAVRVDQVHCDITTTVWFSPTVGPVKMEQGGVVFVLKEFKPGK